MGLIVAACRRASQHSRCAEAETVVSTGPGGSVVWSAQMVAAMPSIIGGTTETQKEIRLFALSRGRYSVCLPCVIEFAVKKRSAGSRRQADCGHGVTGRRVSLPG